MNSSVLSLLGDGGYSAFWPEDAPVRGNSGAGTSSLMRVLRGTAAVEACFLYN